MRERPFFCIGLASFLSVLACSVLPMVGVFVVMATLLILLAATPVFWHRAGAKTAVIAFSAALLLCTGFLLKTCLIVYPQISYAGNTAYVTVRVDETVAIGSTYIVRTIDGDLPDDMKLCLVLDGEATPENGDRLTAEITLSAAFDKYDESDGGYAKANSVYLYAFLTDTVPLVWEDGSEDLSLWQRMLYALRDGIHDTLYRHLSFEDAALCESMVLGARTNLSVQVENDFRVSGVYHLLVVSGLHLSLIVGAVLKLLTALRVPRVPRVLAAMTAAVLFMALCGFTASITRAGVMMLVLLLAHLVRRGSDGLNSLGFAASVMLLIDPFCVYDLGWQLSFAATLGMFVILPVWEREVTFKIPVRWCRPVVTAVGVALSATLMTQPLTALYFGELSLVFLIGNLLCVTASSVLLVICLLSFPLLGIPLVGQALVAITHVLCVFLTDSTALLANVPFASFAVHEPFAVVWLFALVILLCAAYALLRKRGVLRMAAVLAAVLFVCVTIFTVCDSGVWTVRVIAAESAAFAVDTKDSRGLVFEGDGEALEDAAASLSAAGVRQLDWLLWLNAPDESTLDVSSLTIPVEHLVTTNDPSAFPVLPHAERYSALGSDDTLIFSENGSITRDGEAYSLRLGQTKLLVCPNSRAAMTLDDEWCEADVVLVRENLPENLTDIKADTLVLFTRAGREKYYDPLLPRTYQTVHYAESDGDCRIQTRGYGDIRLRSE